MNTRGSNLGSVLVTAAHAYSKPRAYFAARCVASQREADSGTTFARSLNLSRVRIVVRA